MKFLALYRGSLYLMLTLATLVLSIDATSDNKIAMLYPLATALAGAGALMTVDRKPELGLSRGVANLLALGSIGLCYLEYRIGEQLRLNLLLLSIAHWLVYLQLIKLFLPKTVEDDWFLILLGVVQVLVGGVMSQSDAVGLTLFLWALVTLWVLGLAYLHREDLRARAAHGARSATAEGEPYPGLLDGAYLLETAWVAGVTLAFAGLIFLVLPRHQAMAQSRRGQLNGQHLTGFDDEVRLGQMGEILESEEVVMSVEFFGDDGRRLAPPPEPLWRGTTMVLYEEGRWKRQRGSEVTLGTRTLRLTPPEARVRQQIKLEPTDSRVLFGLRPILDTEPGAPGRLPPAMQDTDGTLFRDEVRSGPYDYEIVSAPGLDLPQPGEDPPGLTREAQMLVIPDALGDDLRAIALPLVTKIPAEDRVARAHALESYLRDSGTFSYTLRMTVVDPTIDPVLDFLVNRKQGHCEYFGSALTLLLRSVGIPARMVNGFKGGDWNALGQVMTVRQKHAHTWVEAYLGRDEQGRPRWLTLDPTPGLQRQEVVARVGGLFAPLRQVSDLVRYAWVFYVVGFNADRQARLIYGPIRALIRDARNGFGIIRDVLRREMARLLHFPDVQSFFSPRGFLVSFVAMLLLAGLASGASWIWRRVAGRFRDDGDAPARAAGVVFYRRLAQLLAAYGLERPASETPREFAARAASALLGRGPAPATVADVPPLVVDAFYRLRFGHQPLDADALHHLEARLDALEASLRPEAG